jgi:hypothetical protein
MTDYNANGVCTVTCLEEEEACARFIRSETTAGCLWRRWCGSVCAAPRAEIVADMKRIDHDY